MPLEKELWLVDQLTVLAEAFGESGEKVSPQRLQIYACDLADLGRAQLEMAFQRARRECKFFPKIAELREFADGSLEDQCKVEAEAAWTFAMNYLKRWGVERLPLYQGGNLIEAPPLLARIEYALRRVGGLRGLNQVTEDSRPFMFKDFCEAYKQAPIAESQAPMLQERFGAKLLIGETKQLAARVDIPRSSARLAAVVPFKPKRIPEAPTDAQVRDRREMLRQQVESLRKSASANGGGG